MGIGKSLNRVDALAKVTGQTKYCEDLIPNNAFHAKVVHSTIANGKVLSVDTAEAAKMPGVKYILTCFDVPDKQFTIAGHPLSLDPAGEDISDRNILAKRVRFYGDDVACVVADNLLNAENAASKIKIEYEEYEPYFEPHEAFGKEAIHEEYPGNEIARLDFTVDENDDSHFYTGSFSSDLRIAGRDDMKGEHFSVPQVNACHIENTGCFAYMDGEKIIVVTTTQAPVAVRRNVAAALSLPVSRVKVVKPYIGGGFGNKQDTVYEPLAAFLTMKLNGRPVSIQCDRAETFINTRTRHAFDMSIYTDVSDEGEILRKGMRINSNSGAYAAHAHAICAASICSSVHLYKVSGERIGESSTVYTNKPVAAAMRAYGIPQLNFAQECNMEDMALAKGLDPVEFRLKNLYKEGERVPGDAFCTGSNKLPECAEKALKMSDWYNRRAEYAEFNKHSKELKKGLGLAFFSYKITVWPIQVEVSGCRIMMQSDGGCSVLMGCTELGQGVDTAISQIVSEVLTIPEDKITVISCQDTDIAPYDNGAYASRQTYICGNAAKQTAELIKKRLIERCAEIKKVSLDGLDLKDEQIIDASGNAIASISEIVTYSTYVNDQNFTNDHIAAESMFNLDSAAITYGVSVIDLEVDVLTGKVKLNKAYEAFDIGNVLNPALAKAQVHGGTVMGLGYALGEQMIFDSKGRNVNANLADYKIPSTMDVPEIEVEFADSYEPHGPFGAKGVAEPPLIPQAAAVRNAILFATGVGVNTLPMNPQNLVKAFLDAGLYE